jgi:hypothetical protein
VFIQNFRPGTGASRRGAIGCIRSAPAHLRPSLRLRLERSVCGTPRLRSVAQALSGFLSVVVDSSRPRFLGPALADAITGIYAAYTAPGAWYSAAGAAAALIRVSMLEAMAHFALEPFAASFRGCHADFERSRAAPASLHSAHRRQHASLRFTCPPSKNLGRSRHPPTHRTSVSAVRLQPSGAIDNYESLNTGTRSAFSLATWRIGSDNWAGDVRTRPSIPLMRSFPTRKSGAGLIVPIAGAHGGTQSVGAARAIRRRSQISVRAAPGRARNLSTAALHGISNGRRALREALPHDGLHGTGQKI